MSYKDRCPVCGSDTNVEIITMEDGVICEEIETCNTCGYGHEFMYGSSRMYVNSKEFCYYYNTPDNIMYDIHRKAYKEAFKVQKRLRRLGKLKGRVKISV